MTVKTQQNHDRLLAKGDVANNISATSNTNGVKKSTIGHQSMQQLQQHQQQQQNQQQQQQQKDDQYKRYTENTMQVCNVNLMENTLASR